MFSPKWASVDEENDRISCLRCGEGVGSYHYEGIEHSDGCTRYDGPEPRWAEFVSAEDTAFVEGISCNKCGASLSFDPVEPCSLDDEFLDVEHSVDCTRGEDESVYDGSITQPSYCPRCGPVDVELDSLEHDSRDNGDLEFLWRCPNCTMKFTTVSETSREPEEDHVLQWAYHNDELQSVMHIHGGEGDAGVKWKRAEKNMKFGNCYEVSGPEWIISDLYELLVEGYEFDEVSSGEIDVVEEVPGFEAVAGSDDGGC